MLYDVTKNNMWHLRKTRSQDKIDMDWQREAAEYLECGKPQESQSVQMKHSGVLTHLCSYFLQKLSLKLPGYS